MRLLIVKLSSIGDIVHTLPTLAAIRSEFPDAEISWAVERTSAEILRNNPLLTRLIEVDTRSLRRRSVLGKTIMTARKQLRNLRASDFDLAIDFQGLLKSASISRFSGARFRAGFDKAHLREPSSRHLYTRTFKVESGIHVIQKNLQLAAKAIGDFISRDDLSFDNDELSFPIATGASDTPEVRALVNSTDGKFAILNPAGGWPTKLWSADKYGQLADRLWSDHGISSFVCTAHFEKPLAERVLAASKSGRVRAAHLPLKEFYELAKHSVVYVGGDTGPTHLAVAAGCPVVGIFGPTEWWRNGSPRAEDICVERNDIGCRVDCHRRSCGNWICMDIDIETVLLAIRTRLGL